MASPFFPAERLAFAQVAREREEEVMSTRRETSEMVDAVQRGSSKRAIAEACLEWVINERHVHELGHAMGGQSDCKSSNDAHLRAKVRKIDARRKPLQLAAAMRELESAHLWSRALAMGVDAIEEQLSSG